MKKQKVYIDPENDYFGTILNCAVRYALGRESYMPSLVMNFIRPLIQRIPTKALWVMIRDVEEHGQWAETKEKRIAAYGWECDYHDWMEFLAELRTEKERREQDVSWARKIERRTTE